MPRTKKTSGDRVKAHDWVKVPTTPEFHGKYISYKVIQLWLCNKCGFRCSFDRKPSRYNRISAGYILSPRRRSLDSDDLFCDEYLAYRIMNS